MCRQRFNRNVIASSDIPTVKHNSHISFIREFHRDHFVEIQNISESLGEVITNNSLKLYELGVYTSIQQFRSKRTLQKV